MLFWGRRDCKSLFSKALQKLRKKTHTRTGQEGNTITDPKLTELFLCFADNVSIIPNINLKNRNTILFNKGGGDFCCSFCLVWLVG